MVFKCLDGLIQTPGIKKRFENHSLAACGFQAILNSRNIPACLDQAI